MGELAGNRPRYVAFWRQILCGWLGWSAERFDRWVARFDADLNDEGNPLFYHYDELDPIIRLLIPDALVGKLQGRRTQQTHYDDLAKLVSELYPAVFGGGMKGPSEPGFDWAEAKRKVEAVLGGYGYSLPSASEVTRYERGMVGNAEPS